MFRLILISSLALFLGCTKKPMESTLTKALKAAPNYMPVCQQIKMHVTQLCGTEKDCKLPTPGSIDAAMSVIDKSPQLQKNDVDMLNEFLKIEKPTRTDVSSALAVMTRDCWSPTHLLLWKGLMGAVKAKSKGVKREAVQKLFRERVFLLDANIPTLLRYTIKYVLVKDAVASGLFKSEKGSDKSLEEISAKLKAVRNTMNIEYAKVLKDDEMSLVNTETDPATGAVKTTKDTNPENAKFDPIAVSAALKKEMAMTIALSRELNGWIAKHVKE